MIWIGTSGYSYKDWKSVFYPETVGTERYLEHYSRTFPFVELNFSYYRQPEAGMIERMVERTPEGFMFTIKAHQSLTHLRDREWTAAADRYKEGIEPLLSASRLGGILFQFPYSFHRTVENRRYLGNLTDFFGGYPLFVEFRGKEWQNGEVYASLAERDIGIVNTDNPEMEGLPEKAAAVTSSRGYIRFHGRNREAWWKGDNVSRYDYLYADEELQEWVERIRKMLEKVAVLYIAFNNHHKGQAVTNALQLREKLGL